jgi:hypothetical protein
LQSKSQSPRSNGPGEPWCARGTSQSKPLKEGLGFLLLFNTQNLIAPNQSHQMVSGNVSQVAKHLTFFFGHIFIKQLTIFWMLREVLDLSSKAAYHI